MKHALCVGIYTQDHSCLEPIHHCKADIEEFSSFIGSPQSAFKVNNLHNPNVLELKKSLWEICSNLNNNDHLLFYFSGHGVRNNQRRLQLCTRDADITCLPISTLSFDELINIIKESNVGSVLFILDCCYSGAAGKSILTKGDDNILDSHEEAILSAKGITVLCSSAQHETSTALVENKFSTFTKAFMEACEKIKKSTGWITVGNIYEELRYSIDIHKPKLIGENTLFPIIKKTYSTNNNDLKSENRSDIELRLIQHETLTFIGLLVINSVRGWLVTLGDNPPPKGYKEITKGFYVLFNFEEIFITKIENAKNILNNSRTLLKEIVGNYTTPCLLVYPVTISPETNNRLLGTDKKYILKKHKALNEDTYPVLDDVRINLLLLQNGLVAYRPPEDYMKEAFGVVVSEEKINQTKTLLIKEDSFSRNSKYLFVGIKTNKVIDSITTGTDIENLSYNRIYGEDSNHEDFADIISNHRSFYSDKGSTKKIDTPFQTKQKKSDKNVTCEYCMDEKYIVVNHNTRLYKVPCRFCNMNKNNSWQAFKDV